VELITNEAVSLRPASPAATADNQAGNMVVPLPIGESNAQRRLA
jgi:hypothetical protein